MKLRPLHDRVIVKRLEQETKTASGIVIPDNAAEKPDQGEVLAVGPGQRTDKGDLVVLSDKVGDRVLFVHDGSVSPEAAFDVVVADKQGATSGEARRVTISVRG